jgi:GH15 family glucan-1,4-alpha-glucosidase
MLKLLADENFDNTILRGLLRRQPDIDIIRVQDTELYGANDSTVLAWAAQENRILLTHDVQDRYNDFGAAKVLMEILDRWRSISSGDSKLDRELSKLVMDNDTEISRLD